MGMVIATFLACWLTLCAAPETAIGRSLRAILVEMPAARLSRVTRGDVAVAIVLAIGAGMIAFVGEGDGIRILTMGAPDVAIWITSFEVSAYVDVVMGLAVAASNIRARSVAVRIVACLTTMVARRPRFGHRAIRVRKPVERSASNDNEGGDVPTWALAA